MRSGSADRESSQLFVSLAPEEVVLQRNGSTGSCELREQREIREILRSFAVAWFLP